MRKTKTYSYCIFFKVSFMYKHPIFSKGNFRPTILLCHFFARFFSFQYSCGLIFPCTILNELSARSSLNNFTPEHCYNSISFYSISSQKSMIATEVYFHHSSFYQQPFDGLGSNYTTLILTVGSTVEPATKYSRRQIQPQVESCVLCPLL